MKTLFLYSHMCTRTRFIKRYIDISHCFIIHGLKNVPIICNGVTKIYIDSTFYTNLLIHGLF